MMKIYKMRALSPIDYAAEELKKYLRMMMPEKGDIEIVYDPSAKDGFRLGLLEDFDLPFEAEDPFLDDVVHIDADTQNGIFAGSNPRSVLFAVYRYLKLNGCRFLYPGIDGEYIPLKDIEPVKYHKLADHRFRGFCNEGAESQQCMMDTVEFYPKLELNVYMLEFDNPFAYYDHYYAHNTNSRYRRPEPVSMDQVKQWKRQCEAEAAKRGLQFHDVGHGWTTEPLDIIVGNPWDKYTEPLTPEQEEMIAMQNGKRQLHQGVPINTNLCMSNPKARRKLIDGVIRYAKNHQNVDYLHVWLSDGLNNHCECEECRKMRPSDYYLVMMNELDEALTQEGIDTRIVFIAYFDTLFSPQHITIQNPKRFSLLYAPAIRSYLGSVTEDMDIPEEPEYNRNKWARPKSLALAAAFYKKWRETWKGPAFSYEYHFWKHQCLDPGSMYLCRRIYEDILSLKVQDLQGYVEDGSQRSGFPNGFALYLYGTCLTERNTDFEACLEDYFSHIYGEDWRKVRAYLEKVSQIFDPAYMQSENSKDPKKGVMYNPDMAEKFRLIPELAAEARAFVKSHPAMPTRPQNVSMRLLELHAEYIEGVARFMEAKCKGENFLAYEMWDEFFKEFGKYEFEIERYYDQYLATRTFFALLQNPEAVELVI